MPPLIWFCTLNLKCWLSLWVQTPLGTFDLTDGLFFFFFFPKKWDNTVDLWLMSVSSCHVSCNWQLTLHVYAGGAALKKCTLFSTAGTSGSSSCQNMSYRISVALLKESQETSFHLSLANWTTIILQSLVPDRDSVNSTLDLKNDIMLLDY